MPELNSPLVSVVMPTHNRAALLSKAIESNLEQEVEGCEIIVPEFQQ